MKVKSTNIANPRPWGDRITGINKLPTESIDVFSPGPHYGDGSGVVGDVIGDSQHHGGADKAVYAFAREELDVWGEKLGRSLDDGHFGENLTTVGLDVGGLLINQRLHIGSAVLEVSVPRTPCKTFADWMGVDKWLKRFIDHGDCGSYLRVIQPGVIHRGDAIVVGDAPDHGFSMRDVFAAKTGDNELAFALMQAEIMPEYYQQRLEKKFKGRL